jgi:hypothetical protein
MLGGWEREGKDEKEKDEAAARTLKQQALVADTYAQSVEERGIMTPYVYSGLYFMARRRERHLICKLLPSSHQHVVLTPRTSRTYLNSPASRFHISE